MPNSIDLGNIIDVFELNEDDIAQHLFPTNKHPKSALRRVINSDACLDSQQLFKLATMLEVPVDDLYHSNRWSMTSERLVTGFKQVLKFGEYEAHLNMNSWTTTIFHRGSLLTETVLHQGSIGLSEYINLLNLKIKELHG